MDIAARALDIKRSRLLRDCDYIFYVEDKADVAFWSHLFSTYLPDKTFYIRYYTKNDDEALAPHTGKSMALKYLPYLDNRFMLCLDSDYDYIISKPDFDIHHHIFQTYTYSIENYKCYAPSLSALCKNATLTNDDPDFDIAAFMSRYSEIIYPLFIYSIVDKIRHLGFSISDFSEVIKFNHQFAHRDTDNELISLQGRVLAKMAELELISPKDEFEAVREIVQGKGITPANVYLFIRGHSLYDDIILRLVKSIVNDIQSEKIQAFKDSSRTHEIQSYLDSCPSVVKVLGRNKNFLDCNFIENIRQDIQAIIG
jgi:hypothetical protein